MTDRTRAGIRRAAVAVLLFLLAASLLIYLMLPVFERKKAKEIFGREDVIVGDSFHQPWFYVDEEGNIYFTDWLGTRTSLEIPEYFNGVSVKHFSRNLSRAAAEIEDIRFPASISLPYLALNEFSGLTRLVFSEGQENLTMLCVKDCPSLKEIWLPSTLKIISERLVDNAEQYPDLTIYYAGTEEEWLALGETAKRATQVYHVVYETPVPPR